MAVWQFKLELIPKKWAEDNNHDIKSIYRDDGYDTSIPWKDNQPIKDPAYLIDNLLPAVKSKFHDLKYWGDEKKSDAAIFYEEEMVVGITIRLDMRVDLLHLLPKIIEIANDLDCMIYLPNESKIINSNIFELNAAAKESNAMKFINNPEDFLANIDSE